MYFFVSLFSLSLLQQVCASRQQVQVELREREEVVRELGLLKGWIQDTQGLLLSPTADLDNLLTDLEVLQTTLYSGGDADRARILTSYNPVYFAHDKYGMFFVVSTRLLMEACGLTARTLSRLQIVSR